MKKSQLVTYSAFLNSMKNVNLNKLLDYYQEEMNYLLKQGSEFAKKYTKSAQNIELTKNGSNDPHIQKMIESFAFLTSSIQQQIDTSSSKLNFHLLQNLCPLFTKSIPSSTIMQLKFSNKLLNKKIPAQSTIETTAPNEEKVVYKTIYDVNPVPFDIENIEFITLSTYELPFQCNSNIAIKIHMSLQNEFSLNDVQNLDHIRFFISEDKSLNINLYEIISQYDISKDPISFFELENNNILHTLDQISFPGFNDNDSLYFYDQITNISTKLLTEFMILPEKFLFFDVKIAKLLSAVKNKNSVKKFSIVIPITQNFNQNTRYINRNSLLLMCTPVINIFDTISEYIILDKTTQNIPIIPYKRSENFVEVHSIQEIVTQQNAEEQIYYPYFDCTSENCENFFIENKELSENAGTKTSCSIIQIDQEINYTPQTGYAKILCNNRNYASNLDLNTIFSSTEIADANFTAIINITPLITAPLLQNIEWPIISHIATNHLTFTDKISPLKKIQSFIDLYNKFNYKTKISYKNLIDNIKIQNSISPYKNNNAHYFVPKIIVELILNDHRMTTLFGKILHNIFKNDSEINTIIETIIYKKNISYEYKKYTSECTKYTL